MGFHLKKTFKSGLFNFNLSNSGIGTSFGVKGLRVGVDGKGRTYIGGGKGMLRYRKYYNLNSKDNDFECTEPKCPTVSFPIRTFLLLLGYILGLLFVIKTHTPTNTYQMEILSYSVLWLYFSPLVFNVLIGRKNMPNIIAINIFLGWTLIVPICMNCLRLLRDMRMY